MAEDVEAAQEKPSNACCAALKKKHSKLLEKYAKLEELKNKFRNCTALVQEKYDVLEKENEGLRKAFEELKVQASVWKDEKEKECGARIDLEDEVSALKDEVRLLKQNGNPASQEADKQLQDRLDGAEKEIKQLKELLEKERERKTVEKRNAESEKKKADEALKKLEMGKNKISEAQKAANAEKKKAEEYRHFWENLKREIDAMKSTLASQKSKSEAAEKKADEALKKLEMGKNQISEAQKGANAERKKAEEHRLLWENLKGEIDVMKSTLASQKSKSEAAEKKVEAEKQKAIKERERADLAVAKAQEQQEIAETNLKKAIFEKDRADDLSRKLEEASNRAKKLEECRKHICCEKLFNAPAGESNTGRIAELASDVGMGMQKNDAQMSKLLEKMLLEKEHNIIREKKRADSEKKKAKKHKEVAEAHKKMAIEQKHRADQLSKELESCKLRLEELQKELQELVSYRIYADNVPLRNNNIISESDKVKLLKKQLKLEKMLAKHAKKVLKVEAIRNDMLHQELFHLKQECLRFQHCLNMLDKSFVQGGERIHQLEKIGNQTSEALCSDGYHGQLISGIDSRLDPPCRGSKRKMLQSSAINSSSASFSDRPLVGSQERHTLSVTTSAKLGEDISNLKPTMPRLSDKMRIKYDEHAVAKAENSMRRPTKDNVNERRVGHHEKKQILDAVESIQNLYCKGEKLHQRVLEKLSVLHDILNSQSDKPEEENLKEDSCGRLDRPCKRRKTCSDRTVVVHRLQDSGEPKRMLCSDMDHSDACMHASPTGLDVMKFDGRFKDGIGNMIGGNECISQDFGEMANSDYMKLLDLDNADDENSYRRAVAMPLSPMLLDVEFHGDEKLEVANSEIVADKNYQEGLSNLRDNLVSASRSHVIEMDKNPTNLELNGGVSSKSDSKEDSVGYSKHTDSVPASNAHFNQVDVSCGNLRMPAKSCPGNNETNIMNEKRIVSTPGGHLKYFVVSSDNKNNHSILRILHTTSNCMPQPSFLHSAETSLRSILLTLLKSEDLSMKEKVCVLFSLMLQGISEVGMNNLTNVWSDELGQSLDSVALHIRSALGDPILRRMFLESCHLLELLCVIEDFLLQRKVLVQGDVSAEPGALSHSRLDLDLNGYAITLSEVVAPAHLLVAGGSLLASLCSAFDHIGFVCEMSFNILTMHFDPAEMLAIVHAFGRVCGSKYFSLEQYSLTMTVVKSLVMLLEKQTNITASSPSMAKNLSKIWLCSNNCLFSMGAASMEDVALLLLENLKKHGRSESLPQDELVNLQIPRVRPCGEGTNEFSELRDVIQLGSKSEETLCAFIDILSLVELLASFMSWDWTLDHIVDQICKYLELHLMESFAAAVILLIGQLGRLGVGASGYEDSGVRKLRGWLSAFVRPGTFVKLSLPVQFATINALFGLTPIKFKEILEDKVENPAVLSQSIPVSFIREWFFLLSNEQQSLFHQAASEANCEIGLPER